jgi:hypothetical protein
VTDPAELWRAHQNAQFPPSCLPLAIGGVRLVKIDAVVGAILTGSLRTDGVPRPIDDAKRRDLQFYGALILKALGELPLDAEAKDYFTRLTTLSDRVLKG